MFRFKASANCFTVQPYDKFKIFKRISKGLDSCSKLYNVTPVFVDYKINNPLPSQVISNITNLMRRTNYNEDKEIIFLGCSGLSNATNSDAIKKN